MDERRQDVRGKVIYGAVATTDETGATTECIVRNISDHGARIEFDRASRVPNKDRIALAIARQGRSVLARIIWFRDNLVGVAFSDPPDALFPESDLEERLRKSEKKKRQLQKRIKELTGQD
jgi:hypothetical protein